MLIEVSDAMYVMLVKDVLVREGRNIAAERVIAGVFATRVSVNVGVKRLLTCRARWNNSKRTSCLGVAVTGQQVSIDSKR